MSDQSQGLEAETGMFSLADLAMMNSDETTVLMSRLPDEGIFTVRGVGIKASQTEGKDDKPPMFAVSIETEILAAKPLSKDKDPESYVGRTLRERYTLWPNDFGQMVGLLQGRYKLVGLPFTGKFGAVEGQEPGWTDSMVSHMWDVRVRHWVGKNGQTNAAFDWLPRKSGLDESESDAAA